jgi:hypothetical protein
MRFTLAAVFVVGVALLALPAQVAQSTDSATRTIRLVSLTVNSRLVVDRPPKGAPSKGDVVREESILRNAVPQFGRPKGANVGSDVAIFTVTSARPVRMNVRVTVKLPGGTLRGRARITGTAIPGIRIVGGTGIFAKARGTGTVRDASGSARGVLNIYRLQLP